MACAACRTGLLGGAGVEWLLPGCAMATAALAFGGGAYMLVVRGGSTFKELAHGALAVDVLRAEACGFGRLGEETEPPLIAPDPPGLFPARVI